MSGTVRCAEGSTLALKHMKQRRSDVDACLRSPDLRLARAVLFCAMAASRASGPSGLLSTPVCLLVCVCVLVCCMSYRVTRDRGCSRQNIRMWLRVTTRLREMLDELHSYSHDPPVVPYFDSDDPQYSNHTVDRGPESLIVEANPGRRTEGSQGRRQAADSLRCGTLRTHNRWPAS